MGKVGLDHVMDCFDIWLRNEVKQRVIKFRGQFYLGGLSKIN